MELELVRSYFPSGTNGRILAQRRLVCFSIELTWKDNRTGVSCIPERGANDALQELKGCIAPVPSLSGAGPGLRSRSALQALISLVDEAFRRKEPVCLTIKSDPYEFG